MSLRPATARWFEALVLKQDLHVALDCLARSGAVQLETRSAPVADGVLPDLAEAEHAYDTLAERYHAYWPDPVIRPLGTTVPLAQRMNTTLVYLRDWAAEADETIEDLQAARVARDDLIVLQTLLGRSREEMPDLPRFLNAGPHFRARIFVLSPDTAVTLPSTDIVSQRLDGEEGGFLLAIGPLEAMAGLERALAVQNARAVALPDWLDTDPATARRQIGEKLREAEARCARGEAAMRELGGEPDLAEALGDIVQLKWLGALSPEVGRTGRMAWITGWTMDRSGATLDTVLEAAGLVHLLAFPPPPKGRRAPIILTNPPWSRHFEILTRMLGVPTPNEADPSMLVAIIAPILFGFMFGDIGQGAVLLVAGLALRGRIPALSVLVPGGIMAMVFGVLFGSVFALEDVVAPLWLHPLHAPLPLLVTSVAFGALILTVGLLLDAVQMHWQQRAGEWWLSHAGLVLAYLALLSAPFFPVVGLTLAAVGALWAIAGTAAREGVAGGAAAAGELVETLLQLLVNTVSFARAGAFALAHAGLSVAVVGLAEAAGPVGFWLVLVFGNVFILALEGLVVSIQTTRLVLFEFFIRFLHGGGREFRPLTPPQRPRNSLTKRSP